MRRTRRPERQPTDRTNPPRVQPLGERREEQDCEGEKEREYARENRGDRRVLAGTIPLHLWVGFENWESRSRKDGPRP